VHFFIIEVVIWLETFGMCFLRGLFPPCHLDWLEPHPSVLRTATFPDREGYILVEFLELVGVLPLKFLNPKLSHIRHRR
jgi:hypothetical protein